MNLPSDTPRLPKLVFFAGYAALLATAWIIWDNAAHPTEGLALVSIVACVALAAVIVVIPFVSDYANRQDEALDNRQRSLHALSVTVAAAGEQVSIAATGLQGIAEAAQDNFSKSERLSRQIQEKMAELDARLASAKKDDGEIVARYEAAAKKIAKAAAEFDAAVARATEAARQAAEAAAAAAAAKLIPELPPVIASKIVEIRPAVLASDAPFEAPPAAKPEPRAISDAPAESAATAEPEVAASAVPEPAPGAAPRPAPPAPRKRAPRKPPAPAPAPDLLLESPPAAEASAPPAETEISEPAISSDGATRLVVTAYIGIGNRLFIRGDGPGLSWDKGIPLTFVSIGKWRWDTNDASAAVRFKLYRNDETECTALGERSVEPGAQQELTASF